MTDFTIRVGIAPADRDAAAELFWDAFKGKLGMVMGPDQRALGFLRATMDTDYALSAVADDGTLLGIAGFKTSRGSLSGSTWRDMAGSYGWFGGTWRALLLSLLEREVEGGVLLMDGICVDARARGRGVGTALLTAMKAHTRDLGLPALRLDVIDSNKRARALYERQGFHPVAETHTGPLRYVFGFRQATAMQCNVT